MERGWHEDGLCDIEWGGLRDRVVESGRVLMIECVYGIVSNPITDNESFVQYPQLYLSS